MESTAIGRKIEANGTPRAFAPPVNNSDSYFQQLVSVLPAAVYTTDERGMITFFNPAAAALWGREPELGKDFWCGSWKIYDSAGNPIALDTCPMAQTLRDGREVRGVEIIVERPDGERRHVLPHPIPLRNAAGRMIGAVNLLVDIGERVQAGEVHRRLAAIVEGSDDAIISKNLDGVIMSWNRAAEQLFGYTEKEMLGKSITLLIPPERADEEKVILSRLRAGETVEHYETERRRKDGTLVPISLTVSPIRDDLGRVVGASKIARDISERLRAQGEIERARDEAEAASRAKDDFFAALSHELRTPLNPVLLVSGDALRNRDLSESVRADFEMIHNHVMLEARLIDDLLDVTRITRGKLELVREPIELDAVVRAAVATVRPEIRDKTIALVLQLHAPGAFVAADGMRLQQVFWNLLRNAVKFTPEAGRVTVATRLDPARNVAVIEISDTGIGLTAAELERIFEPFAQGDHVLDRRLTFGGLGLGLAISQRLVSLHEGQIFARSAGRGQGATFTVELPLTRPVAAGDAPPPEAAPVASEPASVNERESAIAEEGHGLSVLLVDDHRPTCQALSRFLARRGFRPFIAMSLAEARAVAAEHKVDVLVSDIGLPDGTGYELLEELRRTQPDISGIAVSGYGMPDDLERSRQAGYTSHCTKPIRIEVIEQALARIAAARS